MIRMTRKDAIMLGLKVYWPKKPCKRGHDAKRYVGGACTECQRLRAKERYDSDQEHRDKLLAATRKWCRNNPERHQANVQAWREANPERVQELRRLYNLRKKAKKQAKA